MKKAYNQYITEDFLKRRENVRPIREREKNKDCDFFVGVTNFQVITAHDVALQILKFFNDNGAKE